MITNIRLSYSDMRRLVIALYDTGTNLQNPRLTFSHGNVGNELLDIAEKIDEFVADLEAENVMVVMKYDELQSERMASDRLYMEIQDSRDKHLSGLEQANHVIEQINKALGTVMGPNSNQETLAEIERLKGIELFNVNIKNKSIRTTSRSSRKKASHKVSD